MASQTVAAQIPNAPCSSCSPRDVRALVVLHVATEPGVQLGQPALHVPQVVAQDVQVDDERRRDQVVPARADRRAVRFADAGVGIGDVGRGIAHWRRISFGER